jgi:hypothetical protein
VRRARWCYARLRTRRLMGGRKPAAMELSTAGYGGGAAAQLEADDSHRSNRQGPTTRTRGREAARSGLGQGGRDLYSPTMADVAALCASERQRARSE